MSIPAIKAVGIGRGPAVAALPGSRIHDEILPPHGRTRLRQLPSTRPTNNAGGLEGGVTNGEDLRVTGYMKPIATLMKPLRSVDLTTMELSPAAIERSDVCAVPAAAVVGEAMVAIVLADAVAREVRRRFDRRSCSTTPASVHRVRALAEPASRTDVHASRSRRRTPRCSMISAHRQATATDVAPRAGAPPSTTVTPEIDRLIDDMIETMYAAPGHRPGGAAGRRPAAHLRRRHVGWPRPEGAAGDGQSRVRRARRHAARRRRLPQRPGIQRHGRAAVARASCKGSTARASRSSIEGNGLLARAFQHEMDHLDGTLFVDRLRGIKRDLIVRKIRKLTRAGKW